MEDEKTKTSEPKPEDSKVTQTPEDATPPVISQEELAQLEKDLESASDTLVSKEVQEQITSAKAEARKEAEKEFATNQRIKDLEAEVAKKDAEKAEFETKTAEQLESFKSKINDMVSSKAVVNTQTPFDNTKSAEKPNIIDSMSEEEAAAVEQASFEALLNRK